VLSVPKDEVPCLPLVAKPAARATNNHSPFLQHGDCMRPRGLNLPATKQTPWSESASELHRPSDRRLSAKWLPTFANKGCQPRGQRDGSLRPYSRFSRQEPQLFFQVAPQLYLRGRVDPVPDPLPVFPLFFFGKSRSAGNRTRASESVTKNSDH
jgi:hypothetical protein